MSAQPMLLMKCLGVGACPLLALAGVRVWIHSNGPATASAQAPMTPIVLPSFAPLPPPSDTQGLVLARIEALDGLTAPTPFPRAEVPFEPAQEPSVEPDPEAGPEIPETQPIPDLVVTTVMGGRVPVAMVNGRPRSVGDHVAPGWTIREINQSGIVVGHVDGRTATFTIQRGTP